ncbi:MAG: hypothetical protein AAF334_00565 [Pseudomonadota bacterium]
MDINEKRACEAVAHLYHTLFTGLILTVVTRRGTADAARWMHDLFRTQHNARFLSSFGKLGLVGMPPAVACAAYHSLSNRIGGVDVEFIRESDVKAWVRFPPPRWIYPGAAICGIPSEVSRAMLTGWYAQNGVSLGIPGLRFVCTGQTVDCQPGLMGYFEDTGKALAPAERLAFRPGETPPPYDPAAAPQPPVADWPADRLIKANRNYAIEYLRTGLPLLFRLFGVAEALHLGRTACWLVGAQLARDLATRVGADGSSASSVGTLLCRIGHGEGDVPSLRTETDSVTITRSVLRALRDLPPQPPEFFSAWNALNEGMVAGINRFLTIDVVEHTADAVTWRIR